MDIKKVFKKLTKKQIAIIIAIAAALLIVVTVLLIWHPWKNKTEVEGKAYVIPVSQCNTAGALTTGNFYSGVVEAQKATDIKADTQKTIKEVLVKEGDTVSEGQELFVYDVDAMRLELEEGQIEIESMQNTITSNKKNISDLETQKKSAGSDAQVSYNTQIQALQAEINKSEYNIKVKQNALSKLENSINNSTVLSPISGTIKKLRTSQQMTDEGTDVIMSIVMGDNFRIKGKVNEQNIGQISRGDDVIIRSRVDENITWKAMITEISQEPEQNNSMMAYEGGGNEGSSSSYAFYAEPDSIEGLRLGQHVVISLGAAGTRVSKKGIWLSKDYLIEDKDKGGYFIWAEDSDGLLEKRYVETGKEDEEFGDIEITDGLDEDDRIAYPSKSYQEGMSVTGNAENATVEDMADDADTPENADTDTDGQVNDESGEIIDIPDEGNPDESSESSDMMDMSGEAMG